MLIDPGGNDPVDVSGQVGGINAIQSAMCVFAVSAGHFAIQVWPRLLNPYFGVDCWRHMLAAEYIARHRRLPEQSLNNYLFRGPFDYPPFIPVVMALFPARVRLVMQAVVSPLFEVFHGVFVYWLVFHFTGDWWSATVAHIVFALVPITILENSQLNARSPGSLFLSLAMVGATLGVGSWSVPWLACSIAAGVAAHMTHKMASQTLVLFSLMALPVIAWVKGGPLIGAVSLGVALIVFGPIMIRVVVGHIAVLTYHRRHFASRLGAKAGVGSRGFVGSLISLAKANPLITIVGADPWIVVAAAVLLSGKFRWHGPPPLGRVLCFWLVAILVLIVTTSTVRQLKFLGDGPRYSYYLAFPIAVLMGPALAARFQQHPAAWGLVAVVVAAGIIAEVLVIQWKGVVHDVERSLQGDLKTITDILRNTPDARVAVLPLCAAEVVAFFGECAVLSTDSAAVHARDEEFKAYTPALRKPLRHFVRQYGITHVAMHPILESQEPYALPQGAAVLHDGSSMTLWRIPDETKAGSPTAGTVSCGNIRDGSVEGEHRVARGGPFGRQVESTEDRRVSGSSALHEEGACDDRPG